MSWVINHANGTAQTPLNASNINAHLPDDDHLYHFGFSRLGDDFAAMFKDVKFVCTGGSATRLCNYAKLFSVTAKVPLSENLCRTDRFSMWKTGPVLWVNHGMGVPSLLIMLHEVFKMLQYAGAREFKCIRLGTCGGIGVKPGTVVFSTGALNSQLEPKFVQFVGGREIKHDATLDECLVDELQQIAKFNRIPFEKGLTMCSDDFYEGQMRMDGFFCEYSKAEKMEYLKRISKRGVKNIEMEGAGFAAFTRRAMVPAAIVCVTLLDRFENDQILLPKLDYDSFVMKAYEIVSAYMLSQISTPPLLNGVAVGDACRSNGTKCEEKGGR